MMTFFLYTYNEVLKMRMYASLLMLALAGI